MSTVLERVRWLAGSKTAQVHAPTADLRALLAVAEKAIAFRRDGRYYQCRICESIWSQGERPRHEAGCATLALHREDGR